MPRLRRSANALRPNRINPDGDYLTKTQRRRKCAIDRWAGHAIAVYSHPLGQVTVTDSDAPALEAQGWAPTVPGYGLNYATVNFGPFPGSKACIRTAVLSRGVARSLICAKLASSSINTSRAPSAGNMKPSRLSSDSPLIGRGASTLAA